MPVLYTAVKLGGALYLIWLGIAMFRAKTPGGADLTAFEPKSGWRALSESITVEALNPKTAIFFLAFLPQFIDPAASLPVWGQFLILGAVVNTMFSCADLVAVFLAGAVAARLQRSDRAQRLLRQTGGTLIAGLGSIWRCSADDAQISSKKFANLFEKIWRAGPALRLTLQPGKTGALS